MSLTPVTVLAFDGEIEADYKGKIRVKEIDSKTEDILEGVTFSLEKKQSDGSFVPYLQNGIPVSAKTDVNGEIDSFDYTTKIEEIEIDFVKADSKEYVLVATNEKGMPVIPLLPSLGPDEVPEDDFPLNSGGALQTGDPTNIIGLVSLLAISIVGFLIIRKKNLL